MANRLTDLIQRYDRRLWVLFTARLIVAAGFGAAMPFVSLYLYRELRVSMTVVGTIMLISALISSVGGIIGGELADRIGRKSLITVAMAIRTVLFLVMAYVIHVRAPLLVVASAFLAVRFVGAMIEPGISAMVADVVEARRRVEAFGVLRIGTNAGWAAGPALGGFLLTVSYSSLFLLTAATSLIGFVLVVLFTTESIRERERERFELRSVLATARDRRFLLFCTFGAALFLVAGQFASTLSVFSTGFIGISEVQLGLIYTLNGVIVVLFQWPAALLAGKMRARRALTLGCLLYALGYLSVAIVPSFVWLMGSMLLITLGEIVFTPSAMTTVADMASARRMGRYMGFFGLTEALGWSAGPFIGGLLLDAYAAKPLLLWGVIAGIGVAASLGFRAKGWWEWGNTDSLDRERGE